MQIGFTLNQFQIQFKIYNLAALSVTLPLADLKNCIIVAAEVLDAAGKSDNPGSYYVENGNIAAGCSVPQYVGYNSVFKSSGSPIGQILSNNGQITWAVFTSDALLNFQVSGGFTPDRVIVFFVQYLPKV